MTLSSVRGDYEELAMIAQTLSRQAESTRQTLGALQKNMNTLQGGDWVGKGADAFYAEMNTAVLPAMKRLVAALNEAASTTTKISRIMKRAEDDAAALFKLDGAATSTQAGGNGALGGMDAGVVSAFAPAGPEGAGGGTSGGGSGSGATVQADRGPRKKPPRPGRRPRPPAKGQPGKARPDTKKDISKMTDADRSRMNDRLNKERARLELEMEMTPPTGHFEMRVRQRYERASKEAKPISETDRTTVSGARWYDARRAELFEDEQKWFAKEIELAKVELASADARFRSAQKALSFKPITVEEMFELQVMKLRAEIALRAVERIEPAREKYLSALQEILPKEDAGR